MMLKEEEEEEGEVEGEEGGKQGWWRREEEEGEEGRGGECIRSFRRMIIFTDSLLLVLPVLHRFDLFTRSVVWDLFIWS